MGRWSILNAILLVIVVLLGAQIVRTWGRALPPVDMTPRPVEPGAKAERGEKRGKRGAAAQAANPAQMVVTIANKDLFDPSRQKATEESKAAVVTIVPPPTGITVVGVRMFGKDREAFIQDASQGNKQRRVRTGDQVSGHTVKSIDRKVVVLVAPTGEAIELSLQLDKKNAAATPGKPGAPPPVPAKPPAASPAAGMPAAPPPAGGAKPAATAAAPPGAPPMPPAAAGVTPSTLPAVPAPLRQRLERLQQGRKANN